MSDLSSRIQKAARARRPRGVKLSPEETQIVDGWREKVAAIEGAGGTVDAELCSAFGTYYDANSIIVREPHNENGIGYKDAATLLPQLRANFNPVTNMQYPTDMKEVIPIWGLTGYEIQNLLKPTPAKS